MATDLENLATTKSQLLATLVEITVSPKPTYSIDGQSVSWIEYHRMILDQVRAINELMQMEDPFELHTNVI